MTAHLFHQQRITLIVTHCPEYWYILSDSVWCAEQRPHQQGIDQACCGLEENSYTIQSISFRPYCLKSLLNAQSRSLRSKVCIERVLNTLLQVPSLTRASLPRSTISCFCAFVQLYHLASVSWSSCWLVCEEIRVHSGVIDNLSSSLRLLKKSGVLLDWQSVVLPINMRDCMPACLFIRQMSADAASE